MENVNNFSQEQKDLKLAELIEIEGITMEDVAHMAFSSVVPGICLNDGCGYSKDVEPDCRSGWCEDCNTKTIEAAPSLMGII